MKPELFNRRLFMEPGEGLWERRAVLNPSMIEEPDGYHMHYRAVNPDWLSTVGHAVIQYKGDTPVVAHRAPNPIYEPRYEWDKFGVEDPRVIKFEGKYWMFHTAFDGFNATTALAHGNSPTNWEDAFRIGPLFTNEDAINLIKDKPSLRKYADYWALDDPKQLLWEKDFCIFPRRINGKIAAIHRLRPDMQLVYTDSMEQLGDQEFWEDYIRNMDKYVLLERDFPWQSSHMGLGPAPIETPEGWLLIIHGVNVGDEKYGVRSYRAGAALLDLEDPSIVIGHSPEPLFEPVEEWELKGDVDNVVFPEGVVLRDGRLDMFYGGADRVIGVVSVMLDSLLDYLKTDAAVKR
ncbi:MAG TPA: pesticidal protein Cry7Aa [Bacteroidetes bacterium]|nr:beta-1,4-mannooligosaccharide phosphorylase [bacterium BMS3Bbin04]HDO64983.1 pesticidal protein Cry7Aa [Bacteroidota bacterium]HEX04108.1 pesticidal protein Cry7Aa [Bacteroidota bacterium]